VTNAASTQPSGNPTQREKNVLVLQGSGALGAYQAGVYHALAEDPDVQTLSAVCEVGNHHRSSDQPLLVAFHKGEGLRVFASHDQRAIDG
jgi:hypothetical protein